VLSKRGRFPSRRTFEGILPTLPETLPERIGRLGRHLVGGAASAVGEIGAGSSIGQHCK
jgi:hypothetical protein